MLAKRLACHGLVFSGGALGALLSEGVTAAGVPAALLETTVGAAARVAAGGTAAGVVSAKVVALIERVTRTMTLRKLNGSAGIALLAAVGLMAGLLFCQARAQDNSPGSLGQASRGQAKKPGREDPAKAGRLYFNFDLGLTAAKPDGTEPENVADFSQDAPSGFQPHSARLSPDGKLLAFGFAVMRDMDGVLAVGPPEKLLVRDLTKSGEDKLLVDMSGRSMHNWCWSADGSQLAFTTWDKDNFVRSWVVDRKTKKVHEIRMPRFKFQDTEYPMGIEAWAPNGKHFVANGDGLHLVKADGTGPTRLTPKGTNVMGGSCRFSPDGRRVLFVKVNKGESRSLFVADMADGKARPVVEALNLSDVHACWSPDGKRIAFSATMLDDEGNRMGETNLYVADADGKNLVTVRTERHPPNVVKLRLMDWR
jgi:hypothetical protein